MNVSLLATLISTAVGVFISIAGGFLVYWATTFCVQPILRYKNIRNKVLHDFIYYAQVINANGANEEMQKLFRERVLANRKTSAELTAAILDLPQCYLKFLKCKGQDPAEAARHLIGFSNTTEYEQSHRVQSTIRKQLGLPKET